MIDITKFDGHTAGPWYHENDFSFIESADGEIVATVRTTAPMHGRDAGLIAAAPDLLAEVIRLRAALTAVDRQLGHDDADDALREMIDAALNDSAA